MKKNVKYTMEATKTTNPHASFFAYVLNLGDYDGGYAEVIRAKKTVNIQ